MTENIKAIDTVNGELHEVVLSNPDDTVITVVVMHVQKRVRDLKHADRILVLDGDRPDKTRTVVGVYPNLRVTSYTESL